MNFKIILFLVFISGIIAGCGDSGPEDYFTGKQGLVVSFKDNMPSSEVFEGGDLYFNLDIRNMGAYTLNGTESAYLKVWTSGDFIQPKNNIDNYGSDSLIYDQGGIQLRGLSLYQRVPDYLNLIPGTVAQAARFTELSPQSIKQTADVFASICYPYKTTFTQEICIDTSSVVDQANPLCTAKKEYTHRDGQGAPIAITKVEPIMEPVSSDSSMPLQVLDFSQGYAVEKTETFKTLNGVRPSFIITIENVGGGKSKARDPLRVNLNSFNSICTDPAGFIGSDSVYVTASIGNLPLKCTPAEFSLIGESKVKCSVQNNYVVNRNYVNLLNVELYYDYLYKTERTITIKKSNSDSNPLYKLPR